MTDEEFKSNSRFERSTYFELLQQIVPHLQMSDTKFPTRISLNKVVCCALYLIGSSAELRIVSNLFGIGESTASEILHNFCNVMIELFFYRLIKSPVTSEEIKETTDGFLQKYGYPVCVGSLDRTHISIKPPLGVETA